MPNIIFEDNDIIVVDKPSGISIQPDKNENESLLDILSKNRTIHLVHRIDQRVSGLVVFAKNKESLAKLNNDFQTRKVTKIYKAIVANKPPKEADKLIHWLVKDSKKNLSKAFGSDVKNGQKAELSYKILQSSEKYHLLEIELMTGRFHQIRSQLAAIGCPIVGDLKYGYNRSSPDGSIFLQSSTLSFNHPRTFELLTFQLEIPELWKKYGF